MLGVIFSRPLAHSSLQLISDIGDVVRKGFRYVS
jgi:hypothetical protein